MPTLVLPAAPGDEHIASSIATEAAAWQARQGRPMWDEEEVAPAYFLAHLEAGELYLARREGEPVGVVVVQWEDPHFWPDLPTGQAVFVHRLAVRRAVAGTGVSQALLQTAAQVAREAGRRYVRLDTHASRPRLCAVYEAAGFVLHSHLQLGSFRVARYELRV